MSDERIEFTQENIEIYLKELAKEYRKLIGKSMPAELVLIGGASVLINYGFRGMTTDIDAIIQAASCMNDAIVTIGDKFNLPHGWLNSDFKKTASYSPKLLQHSTYYKTFSNVLTVRTVSAEYLIAMKLRSGRRYKNDLSDVLGILAEHEKLGAPLSAQLVHKAVCELYGDWSVLPESSRQFIEDVFTQQNFSAQFESVMEAEKNAKKALIKFESDYPGVTKESNVNEILKQLQDGPPFIMTTNNKEKLHEQAVSHLLDKANAAIAEAEENGWVSEEDIWNE